MSTLSLVHIVGKNDKPCRYVTSQDAEHLQSMASLKVLDLSDNALALIEQDFFQRLPKSIEKIILRNNKFSIRTFNLKMISSMSNLRMLDLTAQNLETIRLPQFSLDQYETSSHQSVSYLSDGKSDEFEINPDWLCLATI